MEILSKTISRKGKKITTTDDDDANETSNIYRSVACECVYDMNVCCCGEGVLVSISMCVCVCVWLLFVSSFDFCS